MSKKQKKSNQRRHLQDNYTLADAHHNIEFLPQTTLILAGTSIDCCKSLSTCPPHVHSQSSMQSLQHEMQQPSPSIRRDTATPPSLSKSPSHIECVTHVIPTCLFARLLLLYHNVYDDNDLKALMKVMRGTSDHDGSPALLWRYLNQPWPL